MSTPSAPPVPTRIFPAPPPLPRSRGQSAGQVAADEVAPFDDRSFWERTLFLTSTSFGVSLLLHVCLLTLLAFWIFRKPVTEIMVIDSGVYQETNRDEIDVVDVSVAPASLPKDDVSPLKTTVAVEAASTGSPKVKFDVEAPHALGDGVAAGGGDGKGVFGSGRGARSFVFVVDCSSSMSGERFSVAVSELIRVVTKLRSSQSFYIIFYSSATTPMFAPPSPINQAQPNENRDARRRVRRRAGRFRGNLVAGRRTVRRQAARRLLPATSTYKRKAKQWIHTLGTGGGTRPREALELALKLKPEVIYFLTDGEIPPNTPDVVREANRDNVRINTVALGFAGSAELLQTIARENGGTYKHVK